MKTWLDAKKTTGIFWICLVVWGCGSGGGNSSPGDTTPPTTSVICSPDANSAGWTNRAVECTLTATDNPGGIGVKEIVYSLPFSNTIAPGDSTRVYIDNEGDIGLVYFAVDRAGNHEAQQSKSIKIDKTPPIIGATVDPLPNRNNWNNTDVKVTFTCFDTGSGIIPLTCPPPRTIVGEGEGQVVTGTVSDLAGNNSSMSVTVNIDKTLPYVISTVPVDGDNPVDVNSSISVTFSEKIDVLTVKNNTVTFNPPISGITNVSINGNTAAFKPFPRLAFATLYTVTLTAGIKDPAGNGLEQGYTNSWRFTTRDRAWGANAISIESNPGTGLNPQVAMDGSGNAIAVWEQNGDIWANRYAVVTNSWGNATLIETNSWTAANPQVAVDQGGNATAVWEQNGGIWANRYSVSTNSWGTNSTAYRQIDARNGYPASSPRVAMDKIGNAVAVWVQHSPYDQYIGTWANRYTVSGWDNPSFIRNLVGNTNSPQVAMDASGTAIAVWVQEGHVWANRYTASAGWVNYNSIPIENYPYAVPSNPQVTMDGKGNAIAVWVQDGHIWANRYVAQNQTWENADPNTLAIKIVPDAGAASNPQPAMDASGNAMVIWVKNDQIWVKRYYVNNGWEIDNTRIDADMGPASNPQLAMDGTGNAVAVWTQSDGVSVSIWANRYLASTKLWGTLQSGTLQVIETGNGAAFSPQVAMDPGGSATAVWEQDGHIWANGFN